MLIGCKIALFVALYGVVVNDINVVVGVLGFVDVSL